MYGDDDDDDIKTFSKSILVNQRDAHKCSIIIMYFSQLFDYIQDIKGDMRSCEE